FIPQWFRGEPPVITYVSAWEAPHVVGRLQSVRKDEAGSPGPPTFGMCQMSGEGRAFVLYAGSMTCKALAEGRGA
ncbi:hypothetical protein, partial [Dermatophilus congolensis]